MTWTHTHMYMDPVYNRSKNIPYIDYNLIQSAPSGIYYK